MHFSPSDTPDLLHMCYEMVATLPLENVVQSDTELVADTRVIALDDDGNIFYTDLPAELFILNGAINQDDCKQISTLPLDEQQKIKEVLRQIHTC